MKKRKGKKGMKRTKGIRSDRIQEGMEKEKRNGEKKKKRGNKFVMLYTH